MTPRRAGATAMIALLAATLTACAPDRPTALPPDPAINWPDGPPDSPLETDPAVQAIRRAELAIAHAVNAHYFADPEFQDNTMTEERIRWVTGGFASSLREEQPYVLPGPWPFEPLDVTSPEPGVYTVTICSLTEWAYQPAWRPKPGQDPYPDATLATYTVRDFNGHLLVDTPQGPSPECDASTIHKGYFDPAPVLDHDLTTDEVTWTDEALPTMQVTTPPTTTPTGP